MVKNIKYESFSAGRAGQGQINLQNGELTFVHNDTSSDSTILPINVSHVYSTAANAASDPDAVCGKGFKLNLHQKLQKVSASDGTDECVYVLTDASGKEHEFKETYYYLDDESKKIYHGSSDGNEYELTRDDISIDYDGKLTYGIHEIFTEVRTDSGSVLKTDRIGFKDGHKFQTKPEEMVQTEDDIKNLERTIEDLEFSLTDMNISLHDYDELNDGVEGSPYVDLSIKQNEIQTLSFQIEKMEQSFFNGMKDDQGRLMILNNEYNDLIKKANANIGRLRIDSSIEANVINEVSNGNVPYHTFEFNGGDERFTYSNETGKEIERLSLLASYVEGYTNDHYGLADKIYDTAGVEMPINDTTKRNKRLIRIIQNLQERFNQECERKSQDVRDLSAALEEANWNDQIAMRASKDSLIAVQEDFLAQQKLYSDTENERMTARYKKLKDRAREDIKVATNILEYKRDFVLKRYEEQIPINCVIDRNVTYGFNSDGGLVSIWDAYENYVSIVYENGKIVRIVDTEDKETIFEYVDGRLSVIADALDRRTAFSYDGGGCLETIVYPNGDETTFKYLDGRLYEMIPPIGIGVRLEYDDDERPNKIISITSTESIGVDGIVSIENAELQAKDILRIVYNQPGTSTNVSDLATGYSTTYLFNSECEWVSEYTELDYVMKNIRTYDVGHKKCSFTMQQTDFDDNLMTQAVLQAHDTNVIESPNGDVTINSTGSPPNRFAVWNVNVNALPEHATDLILSGFAIADSSETLDRRRTEYCTRFGHEHLTDETLDPSVSERRFELRAEVTYPGRTKTFVASFDWKTKSRQFAAVPVTLDEDDNGEPIRPQSIKIIADYSNNENICFFSKPSLADGDWTYADVDGEDRKIFECSNRKISDRTIDGTASGKFITYAETFFDHDRHGNLIRETSVVNRNGVSSTYVTKREYNKQSKPIRTIYHDGMISETVYDKKGRAVKSYTYHKSNPASRFVSESEQNEKGQVTAEFDERGENRTSIKYLDGTNVPIGSVTSDGQEFSLGLDPHTDELTAISSSVKGEANQTTFVHTKGLLTRLSSNDNSYGYEYDGWGRNTSISVADVPHVQFSYVTKDNGDDIVASTYANGERYETLTDKFGKLLNVTRIVNNVRTPFISNQYDNEDRLISVTDHLADNVTSYVYNEDGSLNREINDNVTIVTDCDVNGSAEKVKFVTDVGEQVYENVYDDGKLSKIVLPNGKTENVTYDDFGRVTKIVHPAHKEKINYYQNGMNATNIITSVYHDNERTNYEYDVRGNVKRINENGKLSVRYGYDVLGRLIREDNVRLGKSVTFDYDVNGNVRYKNTYPFSLNELIASDDADGVNNTPGDGSNGVSCHADGSCCANAGCDETTYEYAEEGNRDRLTSFGGESCVYDELGNPTTYRNKSLQWSHLKNLVHHENTTFEYNASGLRLSKTSNGSNVNGNSNAINGNATDSNGTNTKFYYANGRLLAERRTSSYEDAELNDHLTKCNAGCPDTCVHDVYANASIVDIEYIHGMDGLVGFVIKRNGNTDVQTYYYRKNIQDDITHVVNENGEVKAEYVYDAWGNHVVTVNVDGVGTLNPFRYRSYYYDNETSLYYLKSRYYDPETGRFINADDVSILNETQTDINGLNLYMYCANNPVMFFDPTGRDLWDSFKKFVAPVVAVVDIVQREVVNTAVNWVQDHWKEIAIGAAFIVLGALVTVFTAGVGAPFMVTFGSALFTSMVQVGISMAISVGIGGIMSVATGGGFFDNIGDTLASGLMFGGMFAGGAQILSGGLRVSRIANGVKYNGKKIGKIKLLSPNSIGNKNFGGTLIKIGKTNRLDVEVGQFMHMHLSFIGKGKTHIHVGRWLAGVMGGVWN